MPRRPWDEACVRPTASCRPAQRGVPATIGEQAMVGVAGLGLTENETNRVESGVEIAGQSSGGQQTHVKHSPSVIIEAAHR
eukprot:888895-Pleurochrysis_carterae.AAC.1